MVLFLIGLAILVAGYFTYGKLVEKIFGPDDRPTPAVRMADGVDYVAMPHWKNMLIQLLNIAGIGPVIGVIIGIKFGEIVFLVGERKIIAQEKILHATEESSNGFSPSIA